MSALFNFQSLLSVILLLICTCAYLRSLFPSIMDRNKTGVFGLVLENGAYRRTQIAVCGSGMCGNGSFAAVLDVILKYEKSVVMYKRFL